MDEQRHHQDSHDSGFIFGDPQAYINQPTLHPGEHDVLLGRGGETNNHCGNVKFRQLVAENQHKYQEASKSGKPDVARALVKIWRSLDPPGRFLAKIDNKRGGRYWADVGDKVAQKRASKNLGERKNAVFQDSEERGVPKSEKNAIREPPPLSINDIVRKRKRVKREIAMADKKRPILSVANSTQSCSISSVSHDGYSLQHEANGTALPQLYQPSLAHVSEMQVQCFLDTQALSSRTPLSRANSPTGHQQNCPHKFSYVGTSYNDEIFHQDHGEDCSVLPSISETTSTSGNACSKQSNDMDNNCTNSNTMAASADSWLFTNYYSGEEVLFPAPSSPSSVKRKQVGSMFFVADKRSPGELSRIASSIPTAADLASSIFLES